jgi:hypothetical protein
LRGKLTALQHLHRKTTLGQAARHTRPGNTRANHHGMARECRLSA